jgi:hypothetical protein
MSRLNRAGVLAGSAISAVAIAVAGAVTVPAQAASTPGWRVVFRHHYGPAANFGSYLAIVAPGRTDAWAFGASNEALGKSPVAVHWNGKAWRPAALPAGLPDLLAGASASSPSNIWVISHLGRYALHWNGTKWAVAKRWKATGQLTGVTALSRTNVWVFGGPGFTNGLGTWHYNGHGWTESGGAATGIIRASALSAGNIWAIGSAAAAEDSLVHFNGTRWTRVSATALKNAQFTGITAVSRTDVWAVGVGAGAPGPALIVHWNGTRWAKVAVPWPVSPIGVIVDGHGGIWVAADAGPPGNVAWLLHRLRSGKWTRTRIGASPTAIDDLALVPGADAVWGAGSVATKVSSDAAVYADGRVG